MSSLSQQDRELLKRLNSRPDLKKRMETILSIAEDDGDGIVKADDAERRIIEEVRRMGNEILTSWSASRIEKTAADLPSNQDVVRCGKKKYIGIAPLVKFM